MMIDRKKGCNQCKDFWQFSNTKTPPSISANATRQARLYQCTNCLSFWEESQRFAYILTEDELNEFYPNCYNSDNKGSI